MRGSRRLRSKKALLSEEEEVKQAKKAAKKQAQSQDSDQVQIRMSYLALWRSLAFALPRLGSLVVDERDRRISELAGLVNTVVLLPDSANVLLTSSTTRFANPSNHRAL